jgi:hypothetical protein
MANLVSAIYDHYSSHLAKIARRPSSNRDRELMGIRWVSR